MRRTIALFFTAAALSAQDPALARLKHVMALSREQEARHEKNEEARIAEVHAALRDWLEPQLPKDIYSLAGEVSRLETALPETLLTAGLSKPDSPDADRDMNDPGFDEVQLEMTTLPELPDTLFVTASVNVQCGCDDAVYAYRFDSNGRTRIIEDHPIGYEGAELQLSDPDSQGRRLLLIHGISTQCGSFSMGLAYAVYRLGPSQRPETLLSSEQGFWLTEENQPTFALKADELIIEFTERRWAALDALFRTCILRYKFANRAYRVEPFALQPQDFVQEWLTAPWSQMQPVSTSEAAEWRRKYGKFYFDQYSSVVSCAAKPGIWAVGVQRIFDGAKFIKNPARTFFLVKDLGNYRYKMEAVSSTPFKECPGEGDASKNHAWLSADELRALP